MEDVTPYTLIIPSFCLYGHIFGNLGSLKQFLKYPNWERGIVNTPIFKKILLGFLHLYDETLAGGVVAYCDV